MQVHETRQLTLLKWHKQNAWSFVSPHLQATPATFIKAASTVLFSAGSVSLQPMDKNQLAYRLVTSRAWTFRPLKRRRILSPETSETKYPVTQRHIPGERKFHPYRCENLETLSGVMLFHQYLAQGTRVLNCELLAWREPGKCTR